MNALGAARGKAEEEEGVESEGADVGSASIEEFWTVLTL